MIPSSPTPLSPAFNAAVMTLANRCCPGGYVVSADAPASLSALNAYIAEHGRMAVSDENSENTIYGDAEHNYAFRAWHDWVHWHLQAEFNPEGEKLVCAFQKGMLLQFGFGTKFHDLVDAEVTGQLETCEALGGCEFLWNGWCEYVAKREGDSPENISRLHLAPLGGSHAA